MAGDLNPKPKMAGDLDSVINTDSSGMGGVKIQLVDVICLNHVCRHACIDQAPPSQQVAYASATAQSGTAVTQCPRQSWSGTVTKTDSVALGLPCECKPALPVAACSTNSGMFSPATIPHAVCSRSREQWGDVTVVMSAFHPAASASSPVLGECALPVTTWSTYAPRPGAIVHCQ